MALIIWDKNYSVGVDRLDADHIMLFSLINHIHEASQSASDETAIGQILEVLIERAHAHFRREEMLMEKNGYPDLDEHIKQHRLLTDQLTELHEEWLRYQGAETAEEIVNLLGFWLEEHILKVDQKYKPFLGRTG
jgi:hemerythrin